jgi:hypothetical protein
MSGVNLTVLEAIDANTALVLLSEIGPDVSRFLKAAHRGELPIPAALNPGTVS